VLELSWIGHSNTYYQAEWRSDVNAGTWNSMGLPILSAGRISFITHFIARQTQQFFRVYALP